MTNWIHPLRYRAIFFDADGTLRTCKNVGQPCPNQPGEWEVMPNVMETLACYDWTCIGAAILSNQAGVALGFLTEAMAIRLLEDLAEAIFPLATKVFVCACTHHPNEGCGCRKPQPGMLLNAENYWYSQAYLHGPGECLYVGDMESDREAAEAAGIDFMWTHEFFEWFP